MKPKSAKKKPSGHDGNVVNVFTWGTSEAGQLGYGVNVCPISADVPRPAFSVGASEETRVVRAAAGGRHSLLLLQSGSVLACGAWDHGQLGCIDGPKVLLPGTGQEMPPPLPKSLVPTGCAACPMPIKVPAKLVVKDLAAGFASSFLVTDFGEVRCNDVFYEHTIS